MREFRSLCNATILCGQTWPTCSWNERLQPQQIDLLVMFLCHWCVGFVLFIPQAQAQQENF